MCKAEIIILIKHKPKQSVSLWPFEHGAALATIFTLSTVWIPEITEHGQRQDINSWKSFWVKQRKQMHHEHWT